MRRLRRLLALVVAAGTGYAMRRPPRPRRFVTPRYAPVDGGLYTVEAVERIRVGAFDLGLAEGRARTLREAIGAVDRARGQIDKNRAAIWSEGYAAGADEVLAELYPESHAARAAIERMIVERRRSRSPGY